MLIVVLAMGSTSDAQSSRRDSAEHQDRQADLSEFFGGDDQDSLAELLRQSRDEDALESGVEMSLSDSDDESKNALDELTADMPTDALDDALDDDEELEGDDEEDSESTEAMKLQVARQRALAGHLSKLQKPINEIQLVNLESPSRVRPANQAKQLTEHLSAQWITSSQSAPRLSQRYPDAFCHRPLYFEEIDLERCGENHGCLQNVHSAGRFLYGVAIAPYRMATQCPSDLINTRGDCRSGQSFLMPTEPLKGQGKDGCGVLAEAAAIAGFTFLLL